MPCAASPTLEARDLCCRRGDRLLLTGLSFTLARGEILQITGANGAGKTTTFHMMVGLVHPDEGKVSLNGEDLTAMPIYQRARAGLSYLPQESSVFRRLTVEENILAILETLSLSEAEQSERAERLMRMLGVFELAKQKAVTLSGGERRRVEIARALVLSPFFILLD
ncbi:MAG: ATP-binding cassette domain-containing protein, partial [Gammaproteobacteria bacterium]